MQLRNSLILATVLLVAATSFAGTWMMSPGKGSHAAAAGGTVSLVGTNAVSISGSATTTSTTAGINVNAGDYIVFWGGDSSGAGQNWATSSPSVGTFTELEDVGDLPAAYAVSLYVLVATSTQSNVIFTMDHTVSQPFRTVAVAVFRTSSGTFSTGNHSCNSSTCGTLAATSTSRTAQNITTSVANSLLIACGIDWNGATHTGANGYAVILDGDTAFAAWKQVSSTGTYPSGNFSTVSATDPYFSFFVAASINP